MCKSDACDRWVWPRGMSADICAPCRRRAGRAWSAPTHRTPGLRFCGPLGWIDVDPTNNALVDTQHITISWGRDYSDVCPINGVFVGGGQHVMTVSADVEPFDDDEPLPASLAPHAENDKPAKT